MKAIRLKYSGALSFPPILTTPETYTDNLVAFFILTMIGRAGAMRRFTKKNIGRLIGNKGFFLYRLDTPDVIVKAKRVRGYFEVETETGYRRCYDGYVVIDGNGDIYPVFAKEFHENYEAGLCRLV